jgi:glycosyltransferase involved in cell wall biosynthesis
MRVAVVNWSSRRVGGIEEYVSLIIPALRKAGLEVLFWHEKDEPRDRDRIAVPDDVVDVCAAGRGRTPALAALRAWKPDVLYIQHVSDVDVEAQLLDIAPAVLFVHTYTGTCISGAKTQTRPAVVPCEREFGRACLFQYFPHRCGGRSPVTMWRLFRQQSARHDSLGRYQAILTHSRHMQREMERHGFQCRVVDYPIASSGVARASADQERGWRLLFAGRMDPLKGGAVLIDALPAVAAAARRSVHLDMVGDGPSRARWEEHARSIERRTPCVTIAFAGWLRQTLVAQQMEHASLLVVPSLWPEPFGSVGPMAASQGVPAAAFDVGGIPQWLSDGVTGHLASGNPPTPAGLAQAIVRCLADSEHYARLREGARRMSARFTLDAHMPQLLDVLHGRQLVAAAAV